MNEQNITEKVMAEIFFKLNEKYNKFMEPRSLKNPR